MTKNEYLKFRNNENYNSSIFFQYYQEHCKKDCLDNTEFNQYFPLFFNKNGDKILKELDKKFGVNKIFNKNGELIKFY